MHEFEKTNSNDNKAVFARWQNIEFVSQIMLNVQIWSIDNSIFRYQSLTGMF